MHPTPIDERLAWIAEKEAWLKTLPPPPVPPDFLGLKITPPDPRDWDALHDPQVAEHFAPGDVGPVDLLQWIKGPPLNQGGSPACVSHTASHSQSLFQQQEEGIWRVFDAMRVHAETGPLNEGRQPDTILKYARDNGLPVLGGQARYKIEAWAFINDDALWEDTIAAALAAGKPVWICFLIPSNYSWESGGSMTSGYHENLVVGRKPGWLLCFNSWGDNFGHHGLAWIPVAYFTQQNWQNQLCRAHIATDQRAAPTPIPPTPTPPTPTPPDPAGFVAEVLRLTNAARVQAGLAPLATHPALMKSAQEYAQLMGDTKTYGHEGPDGSTPIVRMTRAGLTEQWSNWGENIAAGQTGPSANPEEESWGLVSAIRDGALLDAGALPGGAMTDWLNSPGHRANILFPAFTHCGIGYAAVLGSPYGSYWVVDFINLGSAPTPPTPTPPTPPDPPTPPTPTPTGVAVAGRVTGANLGSLVVAPGYALTGQGMVWALEVLHVDAVPTPTPTPPTPPDPPTPTPQPGALTVTLYTRASPTRMQIWAYVAQDGRQVAARVEGTAGQFALPAFQTGTNGIATWVVTGRAPLHVSVNAEAADGSKGHAEKDA